jgi:hypothetical protein
MRFSRHFRLNKKQAELDFVDIPVNTDIPLFLDPYALSTQEDIFSIACNNLVVNFFQKIIDDIRAGSFDQAKHNLNLLGEPNETHLGLSTGESHGKGVSGKQSLDVFYRLKDSKAVETGFLKDLSDCELVIPNISKDKISDMVTNIIKSKLIEYTEQQCKTYNIATTSISSGRYWSPEENRWTERYAELPIYQHKRIILVPKALVRYSLTYNHQKFYNGFVLEYLQDEHLLASTGLVTLLKNGNRVVYKKTLKQDDRYKLTKEFLYQFSQEHPEVLADYLKSLPNNLPSLTNEQIERKQQNPETFDIDTLIRKLQAIPAGTEHAGSYHEAMVGILEVIFYPNLYGPVKEEGIHEGRKRIDITYLNGAKTGFFEYLVNHVPSSLVICECKNYSSDPANPELDQLSGRFSPRRGKFGILLCRKIENKELFTKRCKDTSSDERGFIIALDDEDVIQLLKYKREGDDEAINQFFIQKYKELIT